MLAFRVGATDTPGRWGAGISPTCLSSTSKRRGGRRHVRRHQCLVPVAKAVYPVFTMEIILKHD